MLEINDMATRYSISGSGHVPVARAQFNFELLYPIVSLDT
jgi:hypothetical protein